MNRLKSSVALAADAVLAEYERCLRGESSPVAVAEAFDRLSCQMETDAVGRALWGEQLRVTIAAVLHWSQIGPDCWPGQPGFRPVSEAMQRFREAWAGLPAWAEDSAREEMAA